MKRTGGTLLMSESVGVVAAAGGIMVAGGEMLHVLDRGAKRPRERAFPEVQSIEGVAVAPGGTHHAAATQGYVHVYEEEGRSWHFLIPDQDDAWQSITWGWFAGTMLLYAITGEGEVYTIDVEDASVERFEHPPTLAVCSDAAGRVAMIDAEDEGVQGAWLFDERGDEAPYVSFPEDLVDLVDVAVGGEALAVAGIDCIWLRRSLDGELAPLEGVLPQGALVGHLAFAGAAKDAPLLVGYSIGKHAHVVQVDARGEVTTLAEMSSAGGDKALLGGIAWDDTTDTLWAAWHAIGITFSRPAKAHETAARN